MYSFLLMFGLLSPLSSLLTIHFPLHTLLLNISRPTPLPKFQTFLANLCSKQMGYLCCWETTANVESCPKLVRRKGAYQQDDLVAKHSSSSSFSDS